LLQWFSILPSIERKHRHKSLNQTDHKPIPIVTMFKLAVSLLSLFALMTNASTTIRRLMQIPSSGASVQPIIPNAAIAASAGYGVVPGYPVSAMPGNHGVVPGYGAPSTATSGNGAVVPGYGAVAPGYGAGTMAGTGPQPVVPYGGVAPPAGYQWVLGLEPLMPGQVVPNGGVMPEYVQPGSEGRR